MKSSIRSKCNLLHDELKRLGKVAIAFSGGMDSAFLLGFAHSVLKENCLAVCVKLVGTPADDIIYARSFCVNNSISYKEIEFDELSVEGFCENTKDRCYLCKKELFRNIIACAAQNEFFNVCDGSNVNDLSDFRPGIKALNELNVQSPLVKVGFTKRDIKEAIHFLGIDSACIRNSSACLSSRIPFGEIITSAKLAMIQKSEFFLRKLGLGCVRVRCHGNLARIETDEEGFSIVVNNKKLISDELKIIGFSYIALDLTGYKTGSMNMTLEGQR